MISYPEQHRRGFYISIWVVMRNLGSIIAGAISFALNITRDGEGGVTPNTYLAFLGMECIGQFIRCIREYDGSRSSHMQVFRLLSS